LNGAATEWRAGENKKVLRINIPFRICPAEFRHNLDSRVFVFENEMENQWDVKTNRALARVLCVTRGKMTPREWTHNWPAPTNTKLAHTTRVGLRVAQVMSYKIMII
jgi:hypothetical protein